MRALWPWLLLVASCQVSAPNPKPSPSPSPSPNPSLSLSLSPNPKPSPRPSPSLSPNPSPSPKPFGDAAASLFLADASRADVVACERAAAPIPCLLHLRYQDDPEAERVAQDFFERRGCLAGLEKASTIDGGWRGDIRIVPELPVGKYRRHLVDAAAAVSRIDDLITELRARATKPVRYRARDVAFRFFRSVGRTTPSAYAAKWSIAYNVSGSLLGNADGVRETLVHEIFHLNDEGRGPDGANWSVRALGPTFDAIVAECGTKLACLAPYAPADTIVKGGTYYAFQPGGGVHEYAAELAVRYVRESEAALGKGPDVIRHFKCGPTENSRVWVALVDEFFGGVDLTPACAEGRDRRPRP